jgi:hypothetical protein
MHSLMPLPHLRPLLLLRLGHQMLPLLVLRRLLLPHLQRLGLQRPLLLYPLLPLRLLLRLLHRHLL